ncbi:hypothetical protein PGT21_001432 [Puccinia graminis f. sp. tritici]|uniref:Uncharacterized protein n=1 Tax=Puccinia graminis f. sp. tritici TaxID=56615 RepID=A0A5B0SJW0_PUCGR|nr:hypothetical protein PGT21_001432 [Puccinia graminis f. sp. tritici]KAA1136894.1 hypothetical protein PGTUg99_002471 [Puccinia graminis f. sp. tritici]
MFSQGLHVTRAHVDLELNSFQLEVEPPSDSRSIPLQCTNPTTDLELKTLQLEVDPSSCGVTVDLELYSFRLECPARGRNPHKRSQRRPRAESDFSLNSNPFGKPYSFDLELKAIQLEVIPPSLLATVDLELNRFQLEVEFLSKGIATWDLEMNSFQPEVQIPTKATQFRPRAENVSTRGRCGPRAGSGRVGPHFSYTKCSFCYLSSAFSLGIPGLQGLLGFI